VVIIITLRDFWLIVARFSVFTAYNESMKIVALVTFVRTALLLCVFAGVLVQNAGAQNYPNRTVRIVVPISAGGATDVFARTLAIGYTEAWGQQVIVDNRPGAGGMIGSEMVARAAPDGYTLLMAYTSHVINPALWTRIPYDTSRDFAPVAMIAIVPSVLIVHPSLPARSVRELIAFARRRPHEIDYGSAGIGTAAHLAAVLFSQRAGLHLTHVPYKGGVPALYELLGGQISIMFGSLSTAFPNIHNGRVRALAVTSAQRALAAPQLPTMSEVGIEGYEAVAWFALFAPAHTSGTVINRLNAETVAMLNQRDIRSRFLAQGAEITPSTAGELGDRVRAELVKWAAVVKAAGIEPMKN
jgi:tripartite-type tricarboxylate transporter receptor subunit TctC